MIRSNTRLRVSAVLVGLFAMGTMVFSFAGSAGASANSGCGAYCPTASQPGAHGNQPATGTKGKADGKNPPGQAPNGSDHNKGYECDANKGIGQGNPAHTGCSPTTTKAPTTTSPPSTVKKPTPTPTSIPTEVKGEEGENLQIISTLPPAVQTYLHALAAQPVVAADVAQATPAGTLAFTGSSSVPLALSGIVLLVLGALLVSFTRKPALSS